MPKTRSKVTWNASQVIEEVDKRMAGKLQGFVQDIVEEAQTLSPRAKVNGGTNAESIGWDENGNRFRVFTTSGYGGYLEIGTGRMSARPYIFPAYENRRRKFLASIRGLV